MGVNQQQSTNNGAIRDNVIQLLNILKQRNLGNKIDEEEARRLINDIISANKDGVVELHRSKRGVFKGVKEGYRWLRRSIQRLNTEENRELIKEGSPWLHKLVHQPDTSEDWVEKLLDDLDALDPFREVGDIVDLTRQSGFWGWGEEQVTEMSGITEAQNVTTEVSQTTKRQQVTTEVPQVTQGQQVTELNDGKTQQETTTQGSLTRQCEQNFI